MKEFLKLVWRLRMFDDRSLVLTDGRRIELISSGTPNSENEVLPEFFGASFRILDEDIEFHGSVKVDINSVDWYFQKTVASAQFDNVVLHVVTNMDAAVMHNNRIIPTLVINIPEEMIDYRHGLAMDCKEKFGDVDPIYTENFISRLATDRIERKSKEVIEIFESVEFNWARTTLIVIMRSFGYQETKVAFEKLARTLSIYMICTNCTDLQSLEALFFGHSGYLDQKKPVDPYQLDLTQRYSKFCKQYKIPSFSLTWHTSQVRPKALPQYQIARVAAVVHNNGAMFDNLIKIRSYDKLRDLFSAQLSPYWLTHSALGVESSSGVSCMTNDKIDLIIINGVVPLLYAYGSVTGDSHLQEWAMDLLGNTQEKNRKVRVWEESGYLVKNGYYSQALIQMFDVYCKDGRCDRCPLGSHLLHKRYKLYCKVKGL